MSIIFGPAGLGSVKEAISNLEEYYKLGLKACEIAFTYGVYIKKKEDAEKIKDAARKFDIKLSIHAPYWINLNSQEKEKIKASKKRILDSCKAGELLGAGVVVFHPGFYSKNSKEETFQNIKKRILELQKEIKSNNWKIKLAPETTGKINVFGSVEEIKKLVEETKCSFCIDFAHILAREKEVNYDKIKKAFPEEKWQCHFSGIVFGEKGEKHHKKTHEDELKKLISNLPKDKIITIINESPEPVEDSVLGVSLYKE